MSLFPLNKSLSLKSSSEIEVVFKRGTKISSKIISLYFTESQKNGQFKVAFTVGKKTHKVAVKRNKLKRLMRESFRLNAANYITSDLSFHVVFVYFSSNEESLSSIEESVKSLLLSFKNMVST